MHVGAVLKLTAPQERMITEMLTCAKCQLYVVFYDLSYDNNRFFYREAKLCW